MFVRPGFDWTGDLPNGSPILKQLTQLERTLTLSLFDGYALFNALLAFGVLKRETEKKKSRNSSRVKPPWFTTLSPLNFLTLQVNAALRGSLNDGAARFSGSAPYWGWIPTSFLFFQLFWNISVHILEWLFPERHEIYSTIFYALI